MKLKFHFLFFIAFSLQTMAQIGMANHYPSLKTSHILDNDNLTEDIAFAYSLRVLISDYTGPLVTLRKSSGGEQDFYAGDNDILDVDAVSTWAGTDTVFVVTVYDQSEEGRNASQINNARQPMLDYSDVNMPYWVGDGSNDVLVVNGTMGDLLEDDAKASVLGVLYATEDTDRTFGVQNVNNDSDGDSDRWSAHINWVTGTGGYTAIFDPGCSGCGGQRSFTNTKNTWDQYTFIRRDDPSSTVNDRRIARYNTTEMINSNILVTKVLLATDYPMGICAVTRNNTGTAILRPSDTRFSELIMYKTGKSDDFVLEIEQNQISFWGL